jgi:phosphopantetheinyl transferase
MIIVELPEAWRTRALVIAAPDDARMWLSEQELHEADRFRFPRRREEWLDSRVAAKMLAAVRGHTRDPQQVVIDRPHIHLGNGDRRFISLSHSSPYAGAAIDERPIGIDVQTLRNVDERAVHLFLRDDEVDVMQRCTLPYRLIHFWAAKEAAWKRRSDEFVTLKQLPLSVQEQTANGLRSAQVETYATDDLVVALTRPTS